MKELAKRIVVKVSRYLALGDIIIPIADRAVLEDIVLEALKESEKRGAMSGREENEKDSAPESK